MFMKSNGGFQGEMHGCSGLTLQMLRFHGKEEVMDQIKGYTFPGLVSHGALGTW